MDALLTFLVLVVVPLLVAEFTEVAPWLASRLVDVAVRRLPGEVRERYDEEWHNEVDALPGKVVKLAAAAWIVARADATGRELTGTPSPVGERFGRFWRLLAALATSARDNAARARRGVVNWRVEAPADALGRVAYVATTFAGLIRLTGQLGARRAQAVAGALRSSFRRRSPIGADPVTRLAEASGESVSDVLREVATFRLALETDLLIAAAAADAERVTIDVVADAIDELAVGTFQERLLGQLAEADRPVPLRQRRGLRRRRG